MPKKTVARDQSLRQGIAPCLTQTVASSTEQTTSLLRYHQLQTCPLSRNHPDATFLPSMLHSSQSSREFHTRISLRLQILETVHEQASMAEILLKKSTEMSKSLSRRGWETHGQANNLVVLLNPLALRLCSQIPPTHPLNRRLANPR